MKALVVDDDPVMRAVLTRVLSSFLGLSVVEAEHGLAGLRLAQETRPDVAFVDVSMPHLDGPGLLERLRAGEETRDLPVIAISAARERTTVQRMVQLGIVDYLLKPFEQKTALPRLRKAMLQVERIARERAARLAEVDRATRRLVLVADRDEALLETAGALLAARCTVLPASTGKAALRLYQERKPDVLVLGQALPQMTEWLVANTVRATAIRTPRIYLLADEPPAADALAVYDAVLPRSTDRLELRRAIRPLLRDGPRGPGEGVLDARAVLGEALEAVVAQTVELTMGVSCEPARSPGAIDASVSSRLVDLEDGLDGRLAVVGSERAFAALRPPAAEGEEAPPAADWRSRAQALHDALRAQLVELLEQRCFAIEPRGGHLDEGADAAGLDGADLEVSLAVGGAADAVLTMALWLREPAPPGPPAPAHEAVEAAPAADAEPPAEPGP